MQLKLVTTCETEVAVIPLVSGNHNDELVMQGEVIVRQGSSIYRYYDAEPAADTVVYIETKSVEYSTPKAVKGDEATGSLYGRTIG